LNLTGTSVSASEIKKLIERKPELYVTPRPAREPAQKQRVQPL